MERKVEDIVKEIKQIDNNVTSVIVPMLKDTITDYRKIVIKLIAIIAFLILCLLVISGYSIYKYNDFLSQFEFEGEEIITQDLDTGDSGDIINPNINAAR